MRLVSGAIRRYPMIFAFMAIITIVGVKSYLELPRESSPDVKIPFVMVMTPYSGAGPEDVENLITRKLERELKGLADLKEMTSTSVEGASTIVLEFTTDVEMSDALQKVRDRVDLAKPELPDDPRDDMMILELSSSDWPIVQINLAADYDPALLKQAGEDLQEAFEQVRGVLEVKLTGGVEHEVRVDVDPERLRAYGLTLLDVVRLLAAANLNVPAGHITQGTGEINVRLRGEVRDPAELAEFRLPLADGRTIPLSEVAAIRDATEELREATTWQGVPVIGIGVQKRTDGNTVKVVDGVNEAVAALRAELPADYRIEQVSENAQFVRDSVKDVLSNLGLGILLAGLLLFVFLHDWRQTLIAAVAMPISVMASFMLMQASGFTLNVMSLMALGISVGTLVTNSIVVLENISRLAEEGVEPFEAAERGTAEVAIAVLASTLTNIVVFTPVAFMSGVMGRVFLQFGLTVVYATLFSLVISFTLVPMLAARLVRPGRGVGHGHSAVARLVRAWDDAYARLAAAYGASLAWTLHRKWVPLAATAAVLVFSLLLLRFVGGEFTPTTDEGLCQVTLELPEGTSLERTHELAQRVALVAGAHAEVTGVQVKVGGEDRGVEDATVLIVLKPAAERDLDVGEFMNLLRPELAGIPDARIAVSPVGESSASQDTDIQIEVLADDPAQLTAAAAMVYDVVRDVPGLVEVQTSDQPGKPELNVVPRRLPLAQQGLTAATVGGILRAAYEGAQAGVFRQDGEEYDVVVAFDPASRADRAYVGDLPVTAPSGAVLPLSEVADLREGVGDATILHADKQRKQDITANIAEGSLTQKRALIDAGLAGLDLPAGVVVRYAGMAEIQDEAFASILGALVMAVILIYIVMAAMLESFVHPVTVMATLPLGLIGMALALFFTGETINIMSLMALVMMVGIVVNNAILMLDHTAQLRARGLGIEAALLDACPIKLRPIIMANLAIVIGMVPQAMGGAGAEFRTPMAVVQIGGVLVSTVFTLYVIPVVYVLFDRLTLAGRRERARGKSSASLKVVPLR
ncbi:MAG: efflux RND transporter permease subunit [bacterium]|nr:efflux RND transporter permease subunit [bacterium]